MKYQLLLLHGLLFFLLSCGPSAPQPYTPQPYTPEPPPVVRDAPKLPDPHKQEECHKDSRNTCEDNKECEDVCDDVFSSRSEKKDCYKLPESLVFQFEELLEITEDGDVDSIDARVLECMLDIDEREFAKATRKMSSREAKEFLAAVVQDDDLGEILEEEDDEFNILIQLLHRATGSSDLDDHLNDEIEDDKSFFWLAAEGNEFVWDWLDDYVNEECDRSETNCPTGQSIGAYCNVLVSGTGVFRNDRDLADFLSDADLFADEYQEDVEDEIEQNNGTEKGYLYDVDSNTDDRYLGDFKDYCNNEILPSNG